MKSQKGITLIALVVTIVVLLILAATSIAMLTGDDGIITNAQKAQAANTEGEVVDKMGLAYSAARTESMVKMSTVSGYQPSADANVKELCKVIAKELGLTVADAAALSYEQDATKKSGYTVTGVVSGAAGSNTATITIRYQDNKFALKEGEESANNKFAILVGRINITTTDVKYIAPTRTVGLSASEIKKPTGVTMLESTLVP